MISIYCFLKDEMEVLPRALPTWLPFCDELVLVDTGSTDGSLEWIKELERASRENPDWERPRVRVESLPWPSPADWSLITQQTMDLCAEPWALRIDADETFKGDPAAFRSVMKNMEELCKRQQWAARDGLISGLPVAVGGVLVWFEEPETGYTCWRSRLHRHRDGWTWRYRLDPTPVPPPGQEGGVFVMLQPWILTVEHLRSSVRGDALKRAEGLMEFVEELDGPQTGLARRHYQDAVDRIKLYGKVEK
jgi:glycosyltransferase involved in cell wall biosynthesis